MLLKTNIAKLKFIVLLLFACLPAAVYWQNAGLAKKPESGAEKQDPNRKKSSPGISAPAAASAADPDDLPVEGCVKCHNNIEPMHRYNNLRSFRQTGRRQGRARAELHGLPRRQPGGDDPARSARPAALSERMGLQKRRLFQPQSRTHEHAFSQREPGICPLRQPRRFPRDKTNLQRMPRGRKPGGFAQHDDARRNALGRGALQ